MSQKRKTTCDETKEYQSEKKVDHQFERSTCFTDLPVEIILLICRYLKPTHVLECFLDCNKRLFSCIFEYHQKIDLTKWSCGDFSYYMMLFETKRIHPTTLIVSSAQLIKQIEIFLERIVPSITYDLDNVRHLSLLQCPIDKLFSINSNLTKFKSLETLKIVQSIPNDDQLPTSYSILEELTYLIFYNSFNMLSELGLSINDGLILGKQLPPNHNLKYLTITLQNVNDLYLLLDGLMPNLIVLNVTLCESDIDQRLMLPKSWPSQSMSHLKKFQLTTGEIVAFTFDELFNIVIPFIQLNILTLYISQWISDDQRFVDGDQLQMLFEQFLPQLDHFVCSIRTTNYIDMQTFLKLNERWPLKCRSESGHRHKHLYTIPWSFKQLNISMLADDGTNTVCSNVQYLTLDISSTSTYLSHRFPNIHTLTILPECRLSHEDYVGFRQLRHLMMKNTNVVSSSIIRRIHTMTLFDINGLSTHSIIYPNMKYFNLKNNQVNSFSTIKTLTQNFPNLRSLEISLQFVRNAEYYDSLNIILDGEHLPHLLLLKTHWIDDKTYNSKVSLWISSKTSMKWRSTIFCAYHDDYQLTICL